MLFGSRCKSPLFPLISSLITNSALLWLVLPLLPVGSGAGGSSVFISEEYGSECWLALVASLCKLPRFLELCSSEYPYALVTRPLFFFVFFFFYLSLLCASFLPTLPPSVCSLCSSLPHSTCPWNPLAKSTGWQRLFPVECCHLGTKSLTSRSEKLSILYEGISPHFLLPQKTSQAPCELLPEFLFLQHP